LQRSAEGRDTTNVESLVLDRDDVLACVIAQDE